jgi:hypothetical protein
MVLISTLPAKRSIYVVPTSVHGVGKHDSDRIDCLGRANVRSSGPDVMPNARGEACLVLVAVMEGCMYCGACY